MIWISIVLLVFENWSAGVVGVWLLEHYLLSINASDIDTRVIHNASIIYII